MKAKELVAEFYQSDALRDCDVMKRFLHDNIELHWHSSKGFLKMDKEDLIVLAGEMKRSYTSSRVEFTHLLEENNSVTARYTYYVTPIENNEEEVVTISDETTGDAAPLEDFELGLGSDVGYGDADELN